MLTAFTVTAFYRMMGCGTGRTASVGFCDRSSIDIVLNLTRAAILLVLIGGLAVGAACCVLLLVGSRGVRPSMTSTITAWLLSGTLVLVVAILVARTPWHAVGIMGLPIFMYGTVPASILVAVSLLVLIPATALARRSSSIGRQNRE
jgi:hypothetical protein